MVNFTEFYIDIEIIINSVIENYFDDKLMSEEDFNDKFQDVAHSEIDDYVSTLDEEQLENIIEINGGLIKSIKTYNSEFGGLDELFKEEEIKIKRKLAYSITQEYVMDPEDSQYPKYVDWMKRSEKKCDECDKWLDEGKERCKKCDLDFSVFNKEEETEDSEDEGEDDESDEEDEQNPSDFYNDPFASLGWKAFHSPPIIDHNVKSSI
jgi:hypothetical protein